MLGSNVFGPGAAKNTPGAVPGSYWKSTPRICPGLAQMSCAVSAEQSGCLSSNVTAPDELVPAAIVSFAPPPVRSL